MARLLLILAGLAALATAEGLNPIRRVVTLLQKMQQKIQEEGKAEDAAFHKYMCFCTGNTDEMSKNAQNLRQTIKSKRALAQELTAKKAQLQNDLVEHKQDRSDAKQAIEKATTIREKERSAFESEASEQRANIEALQSAINVLSKAKGGAFLQNSDIGARVKKLAMLSTGGITSFEKSSVLSFLGQGEAAPGGDYQFASGEIIGILKTMLAQIDKDLNGVVAAEDAAKKSFKDLLQAKQSEVASASSAIETKTQRAGEVAVEIVDAKNDAANAEREAGELDTFLANLSVECENKQKEHAERTADRNNELVAVGEAIKILNDDDALDLFKKTLPSPGGKSFLQVGRLREASRRALTFLAQASSSSVARNPVLGLVQHMLRSNGVSFAKVIKMIDDMILVLDDEQKDDDKTQSFCTEELDRKNGDEASAKQRIDDLSAAIEEGKEGIVALKGDMEKLEQQTKELFRAMQDATDAREQEHKTFVQTRSELETAKELLAKAKNKLNQYYNPALYKAPEPEKMTEEERIAANLSLLQRSLRFDPPTSPETWEGDRKSQKNTGSGVIHLMDQLTKDLDLQMNDAIHEEETAERDYNEMMKDSKQAVATNERSKTEKEGQLANTEAAVQTAENDRRNTNDELSAIKKDLMELHANCDFILQNFDFRKEARASERAALNNAKAVLSGANYGSFLQVSDDPPAEVNYQKIEPFGKEDTAHELTKHASKTQDTLVDAVENAEVAEIKRTVFRSLTRLRAATIKEFDTIARLETQAIDAYNDAHHYRSENPLSYLHDDEAAVPTDKLKSFH